MAIKNLSQDKIKPNEVAQINFIKEGLREGLMRAAILKKYKKIYKTSVATFDLRMKVAKDQLAIEQAETARQLAQTRNDELNKALEAQLKSDLELEMMLCQIASGEVQVQEWIRGEIVIRNVSPMEIVQAIKTLFAKRGSNKPVKVANTDPDGNPVQPTFIIKHKGIKPPK